MSIKVLKKGTRCSVINCDVYSHRDTFTHHRYPHTNEELLVIIHSIIILY